jgi:hypothetical protein
MGANCESMSHCYSAPCKNGGSCIEDIAASSYTCNCTTGYSGQSCESTNSLTSAGLQADSGLGTAAVAAIAVGVVMVVLAAVCFYYAKKDDPHFSTGKRNE